MSLRRAWPRRVRVKVKRYYAGPGTAAAVLRKESEGYTERNSVPYRSWNTSSEVTIIDPANSARRRSTLTERNFDIWGNVTALAEYGHHDPSHSGTDCRRQDSPTPVFYPNADKDSSTYIVSLPGMTYLRNASGQTLRQTTFHYDGANDAGGCTSSAEQRQFDGRAAMGFRQQLGAAAVRL